MNAAAPPASSSAITIATGLNAPRLKFPSSAGKAALFMGRVLSATPGLTRVVTLLPRGGDDTARAGNTSPKRPMRRRRAVRAGLALVWRSCDKVGRLQRGYTWYTGPAHEDGARCGGGGDRGRPRAAQPAQGGRAPRRCVGVPRRQGGRGRRPARGGAPRAARRARDRRDGGRD